MQHTITGGYLVQYLYTYTSLSEPQTHHSPIITESNILFCLFYTEFLANNLLYVLCVSHIISSVLYDCGLLTVNSTI